MNTSTQQQGITNEILGGAIPRDISDFTIARLLKNIPEVELEEKQGTTWGQEFDFEFRGYTMIFTVEYCTEIDRVEVTYIGVFNYLAEEIDTELHQYEAISQKLESLVNIWVSKNFE